MSSTPSVPLIHSHQEMAAILGTFGICLLFSGVQVTSSVLTVDIPLKEYRYKEYKIARGDNAMIPCKFTPQAADAIVQVTWTASPDVEGDPAIGIITYSGPTAIKVQGKYKGRAAIFHDIPNGKADLQLQRVTSADTRVYECRVEVLNNDEDAVSDTVNLIVLGKTLRDLLNTSERCFLENT